MRNGKKRTRKPETRLASPGRANGEQLLFVYGTLMRGGDLHYLLATDSRNNGVKFVGRAKIRAELYRPRHEDYPGAVATAKRNRFVHGELYSLKNAGRLLKRVDKAEGCDEALFTRKQVDVLWNGKKLKAWTYLYAKSVSTAEPIPRGKFKPVHAVD